VGLDVGRLVRLGLVALVILPLVLVSLDVRLFLVALTPVSLLLLLHDRLLSRELDAHHQTAGIAGIFPRLMRIATVAT
jgi:hypothetical protein